MFSWVIEESRPPCRQKRRAEEHRIDAEDDRTESQVEKKVAHAMAVPSGPAFTQPISVRGDAVEQHEPRDAGHVHVNQGKHDEPDYKNGNDGSDQGRVDLRNMRHRRRSTRAGIRELSKIAEPGIAAPRAGE